MASRVPRSSSITNQIAVVVDRFVASTVFHHNTGAMVAPRRLRIPRCEGRFDVGRSVSSFVSSVGGMTVQGFILFKVAARAFRKPVLLFEFSPNNSPDVSERCFSRSSPRSSSNRFVLERLRPRAQSKLPPPELRGVELRVIELRGVELRGGRNLRGFVLSGFYWGDAS